MLFQTVHYQNNAGQDKYQDQLFDTYDDNWDDTWHKELGHDDILTKLQTENTNDIITDSKQSIHERFESLNETRVTSI